MHQPVGQLAVVGDQQQSPAYSSQPTHHDPAPIAQGREMLENRGSAFGIVPAGDFADRFVIGQYSPLLPEGAYLDQLAVDPDLPAPLTDAPSCAGTPFTVMRPWRIQSSIWRREPSPMRARNFCRRSVIGRFR